MVSLNVIGLNTPKKRDRVITKLKRDKAQIIYLQETHLNKVEHDKLKRYGYRHVYSS
jgi:exonuclease III